MLEFFLLINIVAYFLRLFGFSFRASHFPQKQTEVYGFVLFWNGTYEVVLRKCCFKLLNEICNSKHIFHGNLSKFPFLFCFVFNVVKKRNGIFIELFQAFCSSYY